MALYLAVNIAVVEGYRFVHERYDVSIDIRAPGKPAEPKANAGAKPTPELSMFETMALVSLTNALLLVLVPLNLHASARATLGDLGISGDHFARNVLTGVVAFPIVAPAVYLIFFLAQFVFPPTKHVLEDMLRKDMNPATVTLAILSAVILAPLTEELLFRAVLQGWLTRLFSRERDTHSAAMPLPPLNAPETEIEPLVPAVEGLVTETPASPYHDVHAVAPPCVGPEMAEGVTPKDSGETFYVQSRAPVVITSLLFAAVHAAQMPAPIAIFFLSLALGTLYERTGSLVSSITLHALFNGWSTLLLLLTARPDP